MFLYEFEAFLASKERAELQVQRALPFKEQLRRTLGNFGFKLVAVRGATDTRLCGLCFTTAAWLG